ncbi:MAG: class I SAM-dependent methyltransferase [Patescibacteria group bacterium]
MNKKYFSKLFAQFVEILNQSGFVKENFLFHSYPYVNGFYPIFSKFASLAGEDKNIRILDFGCGSGFTSFVLSKMGYLVEAIDIYDVGEEIQDVFKTAGKSSQMTLWKNITDCSINLNFNYFDGTHIPFTDAQFDHIFVHAVIEHVPSQILDKVITEMTRVLKPSGLIVISRTPNRYALTEFLVRSHEILFSRKELLKKFSSSFEPVFCAMTDFFPEHFPGVLQKIANIITRPLALLDATISRTPLSLFSHHHFIIMRKVARNVSKSNIF